MTSSSQQTHKSKPIKKKSSKTSKPTTDRLTSESLFDLSIEQEEQADRYQFGPKSKRHYERSIENYKSVIGYSKLMLWNEALQSRESNRLFDSYFNLARVLVHYSMTFCEDEKSGLERMMEGIGFGRKALELAEMIGDQNEIIDSNFQFRITFEHLQGVGKSETVWEEARIRLIKAFELQSLMYDEQVEERLKLNIKEDESEEGEIGESEREDQVSVQEVYLMTPSLNQDLEIANCLIGAELTIMECSLNESNVKLDEFENRLKSIITRLEHTSELYHHSNSPNEHFLEFINLTNNYSLLCTTYAILLYRSNSSTLSDLESLKRLCEKTEEDHRQILNRLRFLLGQSELNLLLYYLSNQTNPSFLKDSFRLSIEGLNESQGSDLLEILVCEIGKVQIRLKKRNEVDQRKDWNCRNVRFECIQQIVQLKWLLIIQDRVMNEDRG
ncbi:hypothetical protein DFH28DRAFT_923355 [Melampsora americana]|nr:hypothetical protein DFH28DRAFT_923355 [Melampsora americana]